MKCVGRQTVNNNNKNNKKQCMRVAVECATGEYPVVTDANLTLFFVESSLVLLLCLSCFQSLTSPL